MGYDTLIWTFTAKVKSKTLSLPMRSKHTSRSNAQTTNIDNVKHAKVSNSDGINNQSIGRQIANNNRHTGCAHATLASMNKFMGNWLIIQQGEPILNQNGQTVYGLPYAQRTSKQIDGQDGTGTVTHLPFDCWAQRNRKLSSRICNCVCMITPTTKTSNNFDAALTPYIRYL